MIVLRQCKTKPLQLSPSSLNSSRSTQSTGLWQQRTPRMPVRWLSQSNDNYEALSRFGVGGNQWTKWARNPKAYEQLIQTSLRNGVSLLEVAGPEGGELALANAYRQVVLNNPDLLPSTTSSSIPPLTVTTRIGYRTIASPSDGTDTNDESKQPPPRYDGDVVVEEAHSQKLSDTRGEEGDIVIHNLSQNYIQQKIESIPPLVQLGMDFPDHVRIVYLIHNPEAQVLQLLRDEQEVELAPLERRQEYIQQRLSDAMEGLEDVVAKGLVHSYGVVSNGLGLPAHHALHLSPTTLLNLSSPSTRYGNFTTVQLPLNLLETGSKEAIAAIHDASSKNQSSITNIYAMRPLMSYPDLGTGTALPLELVDFSASRNSLGASAGSNDDQDGSTSDPKNDLVYTNQWHGPPSMYQVALQTALSHFDADPILELQAKGEKLTTEQRETLEGCKLFQSMLHDLDVKLENVSSFAAHEQELYQKIIPLIYDSFEEVDESTSQVLQAFFVAYGLAVRYQIASKTRQLLTPTKAKKDKDQDDSEAEESSSESSEETATKESSPDSSSTRKYDIPSDMTLQEYAFRFVLKDPAISRVIVGASSIDEFVEDLRFISKIHVQDDKGK